MFQKKWMGGLVTMIVSLCLLFIGIHFILDLSLTFKNYVTLLVFTVSVGIIVTMMQFYKMKASLIIFLIAVTLGFIDMFRNFIVNPNGVGDMAGILSLIIFTSFGFGVALFVHMGILLFQKNRHSTK